jgi:hypothetical protein
MVKKRLESRFFTISLISLYNHYQHSVMINRMVFRESALPAGQGLLGTHPEMLIIYHQVSIK